MADRNTDRDEGTDTAGRILEGTRAGTFMQTRFQRIPDAHLNRETVAGIRDMNMGRVRADGTRVGKLLNENSVQYYNGHFVLVTKGLTAQVPIKFTPANVANVRFISITPKL